MHASEFPDRRLSLPDCYHALERKAPLSKTAGVIKGITTPTECSTPLDVSRSLRQPQQGTGQKGRPQAQGRQARGRRETAGSCL